MGRKEFPFVKQISTYDIKLMYTVADKSGEVFPLEKKTLDNTVEKCRSALAYMVDALNNHYDKWKDLKNTDRKNFIDHFFHGTKKNKAMCDFDDKFPKFPCYLRRSVQSEATGIVSSYRSNHKNWEETGQKGSEPKISLNHHWTPVLYQSEGGEIKIINRQYVQIKVFKNNDWVWMGLLLKNSDVSYIERHCFRRKSLSPCLKKKNGNYYLSWPWEENIKLPDVPVTACRICAVDLGIITDATCSIMDCSGTVYAREFINFAEEKDRIVHMCNRIKGNQQRGQAVNTLWAYTRNFNSELSRKIANRIIDFAILNDASYIVFEHLRTGGKKKGSRKQRLALWKHQEIQQLVEYKAHRYGMRVSRVNARNTSRLAYDGSGKVKRGKAAGNLPYDVCLFSSGKIYNCDLSASYNIGARFFLRTLRNKFPDCGIPSATSCTLADLWKNSILFRML